MKWTASLPGELRDDLIIGMYSGDISQLPPATRTPLYAVQFLIRGDILIESNQNRYRLEGPCGHFVMSDHPTRLIAGGRDCEICGFAFSPQYAETLRLIIPRALLSQVYTHPIWKISDQRLKTILDYFELLHDVVPTGNREVINGLMKSFVYFLSVDFEQYSKIHAPLSRPEEIAGRFLSMVEKECRSHHSIDWYAEQMCLSTKYVANVVKQVTGKPAGECIDEAIMRRARSLLLTTPLSIQELSVELGFCNQSHFGTFFRRATGVSPKTYRQQQH